MKKLFELIGNKRVNGEYGMEIEVEGHYLPEALNDKRWRAERDGSLRGESMEYILAKPLNKDDVRPALESLAEELSNSKLDFSFRTSVHVHMNVQNLTYDQYLALLYTYILLEEPLISFCGKERKGNRFCLRLQDAEGILDTFDQLFRYGDRMLFNIIVDQVRYAAINVGATMQYGSLEFRGMRGNLDVDLLSKWVEILDRMKQFSIKMGNPSSVYEMYADTSPDGFLEAVLGDLADDVRYPRLAREVARSFSLSLDLPYAYKAYVKEQEELKELAAVKPKKAEKKIVGQRVAMPQFEINPAGFVIRDVELRGIQLDRAFIEELQDAE